MLWTELLLRILPVCVRPQRVIEENDNDNRHSNEKKGHFDWEETSGNDKPDNPSHGKALCCSKDTCLCIPLLAFPTPLRQPQLPILQTSKLRLSPESKISPMLEQMAPKLIEVNKMQIP